MDWTSLLPATPAPHLPAAAFTQDLPLFAAIGSELETLVCSGPEAAKFLQGQVTCDLNEVTQGQLRLGAHCNAKGRAQSTFLALADAGSSSEHQTITLLLPAGMAEPTEQQLKKFAMFSKVSLRRPASAEALQAMLVGGRQVREYLQRLGLTLSGRALEIADGPDGVRGAELSSELSLFLLLMPAAAVNTVLGALPGDAIITLQNGWWQCLTALGQAQVLPVTQEEFIPQELNYDLIQGISFKKGCYKGQEIIARLHFKGTPKFRTLRFSCDIALPVLAGTHLSDANGSRVGQVAQVARTGEHSCEMLLVVKPDTVIEGAPLTTDTGVTLHLTRLPLPYALP